MTMKQVVRVGRISEAIEAKKVPLSVVTKGAGLVFVSGLPPLDLQTGELVRGDILVQTRHCLENVKAALESAGSSLDKALKITVYITNCAYFDDVNRIYGEYFTDNPPARTFVNVGAWPWPFDIEIEAVALA
jgi:2-iminobutanoate/2-iminopropanoate deaminase